MISSLAAGGAERVMSNMANHWASLGAEVSLITLSAVDSDFYRLDPAIRRVSIAGLRDAGSTWRGLLNNLSRIRRLRRAIRAARPQVVVSFLASINVLVLIASRGLAVPVVISERNHPSDLVGGRGWGLLRRLCYRWAEALVVQTPQVEAWARRIMPLQRVVRIPNPVLPPPDTVAASEDLRLAEPFIVAIGRLAPQKGFDLLLEAFARTAARHTHGLVLLGEGRQRAQLEEQARQLGLDRCLVMPGRIAEPTSVLRRADAFVLSSRYEGFPNALLEAMSCGLPVVSFDCPDGPREILSDGERGLLVPAQDIDALAAGIDRVLSNPSERRAFAARAIEVTEEYAIERVMGLWDQTLQRAAVEKAA